MHDVSDALSVTESSIAAKLRQKLPIVIIALGVFVLAAIVFFMYVTSAKQPVSKPQPAKTAFESKKEEKMVTTKKRDVAGFLPSWVVASETLIHTDDLTQLIYFGLGVNANGELIRFTKEGQSVLEWQYFTSDRFTRIRKDAKKKGVKILLAIKSFDNETIDTLISNNTATKTFTLQLQSLITKYKLDGVNLDFEYFTDSNFPTAKFLTPFLSRVANELKSKNAQLIFSIDINATVAQNDRAYDMKAIGKSVDQIILMAYDYHQAGSARAGPIAPLFASSNEHSVDRSVRSMLHNMDSNKLLLGIPFYGYEWQTVNSAYKSETVPESGSLATYKRILSLQKTQENVSILRDKKSTAPWIAYAQGGAIKQIYYEDEKTLIKKLDYVLQKDLGGISIWALGYEGEDKTLWKTISERLRR